MLAIHRTFALRLVCLMTCLALLSAPGWGGETEAPATDAAKAKAVAPSAKQIDQWVKEMDDDSSAVRDAAVDKLTGGGKAVIPAVAKAARGDSLEVTVRAISVLQNLLDSKDVPTKAAAKAALEDLAKAEKHESGRQARQVLKSLQPTPRQPRFGMPGQIVVGGNVVRLLGAGGGGFRMSTTEANGVKTTDVDDNGKKIKIVEDAKTIAVTVTEPAANGKKPKPKTYKAANAKELKKKHPEGYKLYEKYGKNAAAGMVANLQVIAGGGAAGPVQVQVGQAQALPVRRPRMMRRADALKLLKQAEDELAEAVKALETAQEARKNSAAGKSMLDETALLKQIKQAREKVTKAREGLDPAEMIKRLQKNLQQRQPAGNK